MEKINIAIADDNERMQEMLGNVIKQDDTLELIGQTGNGNDIYSIIPEIPGKGKKKRLPWLAWQSLYMYAIIP